MKRIVEHTADQFTRLVVVGVMAWLSTQAFINIGAMIGLLPLKGITLPLISQGGTSLIFLTAALGVVFQISRYTSYSIVEPKNQAYEPQTNNHNSDWRRVRRAYNPALTSRPRT
jgi:cell division protein FtsW